MSKPRIKSTVHTNPAPTFNEWVASVLAGYKPSDAGVEAAWGDLAANRHTNGRREQ